MNQSDLARAIGSTQGAVQQILNGSTQRSRLLPEIARALGVSVPYLLGESDDNMPESDPAYRDESALLADSRIAQVTEVDIKYAMGGGTFVGDHVEERLVVFDAGWLRRITSTPASRLFIATGAGDSMFPTLLDNDQLLIDRNKAVVDEQERIWAINYGELSMIKRIRRLPANRLLIMSDNQQIADFEAAADEVHVLGRVVWIGRSA